MAKHELVCIVCPMGCRLTVTENPDKEMGYDVIGNKCKRGLDYGVKELVNPTRVLTSTVKIKHGILNRVPVRTNGEIPKTLIFKCMEELCKVELTAPVSLGDVVISNVLGTGVDIITSRSMERVEYSQHALVANV